LSESLGSWKTIWIAARCGVRAKRTALELYAEAFEGIGALDKLDAFAGHHGPDFYGLPRNTGTVTLKREPWTLPSAVPFGEAQLKPLRGGETLNWKLIA
jgi:dihydroorotase